MTRYVFFFFPSSDAAKIARRSQKTLALPEGDFSGKIPTNQMCIKKILDRIKNDFEKFPRFLYTGAILHTLV